MHTCVSPNADWRSLLNLNVSRGDTGGHIYMQCVRPLNTSLSHMPFKRYCSLCLFGKHLSRDVTFSADSDPDLCIPFVKISTPDCAPLKINTVTTAAAHRIPCLQDAGFVSVASRYIVGLGWILGRIRVVQRLTEASLKHLFGLLGHPDTFRIILRRLGYSGTFS